MLRRDRKIGGINREAYGRGVQHLSGLNAGHKVCFHAAFHAEGIKMTGRLAGKVAIISGGATGMGGAASKLFAAEGARVAIIDRNEQASAATVAEITAAGGVAAYFVADVSDEAQVQKAVAGVAQKFGSITVLFNHAGTIVIKPFLETTLEEWEWLHAVNVRSMYLMTRAVIPHMLDAGGGSIVCTSSISAVAATPMEVLYDTTKGACHMFARAIAVEFRDRNIRCNAVCPGFIRTPHGLREVDELQKMGVDVSEEAMTAAQGRIGEPEEVARAALFLASDEASFITGTHLFVDNGFTAI
jgi:NAD(P)-dependent dehydrogenase (short-subunit alcohol dehydrogenase family)